MVHQYETKHYATLIAGTKCFISISKIKKETFLITYLISPRTKASTYIKSESHESALNFIVNSIKSKGQTIKILSPDLKISLYVEKKYVKHNILMKLTKESSYLINIKPIYLKISKEIEEIWSKTDLLDYFAEQIINMTSKELGKRGYELKYYKWV